MTNVISFPIKEERPSPLPRRRVYYIGFRYVGPMFCKAKSQALLIRDCEVQMVVMLGTACAAYCPLTFVICINYFWD